MIQTLEAGETIRLMVNGAPRKLARNSSVSDLLESLRIDPRLVVIEHNRGILRDRGAYQSIELADGDVVEIVHFVGGG